MQTFATTIRKNVYLLLGSIIKKQRNDVIILCYHSIARDDWRFSVDFADFKQQIEYLITIRKPITLEDLENYLNGKKDINSPSFIITFDDGYKNILQTVSFFQKNNIQPTLFLLGDTKNADRYEMNNNLDFLTVDEISLLQQSGWTLGVHSATHADFHSLNENSMQKEIVDSKKNLEIELNTEMKYFSYPKGAYSQSIINLIKKSNYRLAVSMDDGFINKKTNKFLIPRIGIDKTHSFEEFKVLFSPLVIWFRGFMKQTPIKKYFVS